MGERIVRNDEVRGSIPLGSTTLVNGDEIHSFWVFFERPVGRASCALNEVIRFLLGSRPQVWIGIRG
jgi:hypothetical protein